MAVSGDSIVGRDAELERLRALVAAARDGASGALCVFGPAGQGKTALLDRLCSECADAEIVRATGIESESELPFGTLDAVVRPLLEHLDLVPAAQRRALEAALALSADAGAPADPFAIGAGTLSLLAAAAEERPLLCLVDDLHWVDDASRRALLFAVRRLRREPVAVVLATRGDDAPAVPDLQGIEQLRVGPLGAEEARAILLEMSGGRLASEIADQLVAAAAGNPLMLLELAARLTPEQLAGRDVLIGPPPPGARARDLLAERVAALPEPAARALLVVTTVEDSDVELLRGALREAGASLDDLLPAEEAGLLQLRAGRLELRHPLVRSVAYHEASPDAKRRAHAAVAAALPESDGRRAWHLAGAATEADEEVAAALDAEAERVRLRGGYVSSARTRVRAADMTPDPGRRVARLLEGAGDFELGGSFAEARRVLAAAREMTDDPAVLARIRGVEASLLLRGGHAREARDALLAQARALEDRLPTASARFYLQSAFASMANAEADAWEAHARSALAVVPADEERTRAVGEAMLASALVAAMRLDEAEPLLAKVEARVVDRAGDDPIGGAVEVYALMARSLVWIERFGSARAIVERLERDARRLGVIAGLPYILNMRASLETHVGRWGAAQVAVAEQIALARDSGDELFLHAGLATSAWIAAIRGDDERCVTDAQAALGGAGDLNLSIAVFSHWALGLLALGRGEMETALNELRWLADRAGYPEPGSRGWEPDLVEALIRSGETGAAEERLAAWEADAERTGRVTPLATAARCRGLLVADEEVDATFARALELHERLPVPFQRARTLYCYGERLRRGRRRSDARAPLRDALAIFEHLGAAAWAAKARTELRATGGMVPVQSRAELDELTPHELQVALLVAEGKTNREVAAALFLAPKTIEHHLSAIFRKLDIRRRTELARVFAAELAEQRGG